MNTRKLTAAAAVVGLIFNTAVYAQTEFITEYRTEVTADYADYLKDSDRYAVIPDAINYDQNYGTLSAAADLPEKYRSELDDERIKGKIPPVRDQGLNGDCWAYAATAAGEYSSIINSGMDFGAGGTSPLWSEPHLAAAMYNTRSDAYKEYTVYSASDAPSGGNREMATSYYTRSVAAGPVSEARFGKTDYEKYKAGGYSDYKSVLDAGKDGDKLLTLRSAEYITDIYEGSSILRYDIEDGAVANLSYELNEPVIDAIKRAVISHGAVGTSYLSYDSDTFGGEKKYFSDEYNSYYLDWEDMIDQSVEDINAPGGYNGVSGYFISYDSDRNPKYNYSFTIPTNHGVTIVGWDDTFSADNFVRTPVNGNGEKVDGAWIVRNSWGGDWGDNGYQYISYLDPAIGFTSYTYDFSDEKADYIHTYELTGVNGQSTSKLGFEDDNGDKNSCTVFVSRFNTEEDVELLKAIGIYTTDTSYTYEVIVQNADGSKTPGEVSISKFGESKNIAELIDPDDPGNRGTAIKLSGVGYKTVRLANPVEVSGTFDIIIKVHNDTDSNRGYSLPIVQRIEYNNGDTDTTNFVPKEGVSFLAERYGYKPEPNGGKSWVIMSWEDTAAVPSVVTDDRGTEIGTAKSNWAVKAYTDGETPGTPPPTESEKPTDPAESEKPIEWDYAINGVTVGENTVTVTFTHDGTSDSGVIAAAAYDDNGVLTGIDFIDIPESENEATLRLDASEAKTVSAFIWNGFSGAGIKPISAKFNIENNVTAR